MTAAVPSVATLIDDLLKLDYLGNISISVDSRHVYLTVRAEGLADSWSSFSTLKARLILDGYNMMMSVCGGDVIVGRVIRGDLAR